MPRRRPSTLVAFAAILAAGLTGCGSKSSGDVKSEITSRLGVSVHQGVSVTGVAPGSPSAREGVQQGDIITAVGGKETPTLKDLAGALKDHQPGERVTVAILRNGKETRRSITLGPRAPGPPSP